jgi:ethanolamine-phosphate cytidylyltransferase
VKQAGKYIEIPRSENIATTDLIERILNGKRGPVGFSLSVKRVLQFAKNMEIYNNRKNVYLAGHFDLFHPGHVEILKRVKGVFSDANLVVGVVSRADRDVLTEGERMISLLSCKYVDDVVISASTEITEEFMNSFKIAIVVKIENHADFQEYAENVKMPAQVQITTINCGDVLTTADEIKNRILDRSLIFVERNNRKLNRF